MATTPPPPPPAAAPAPSGAVGTLRSAVSVILLSIVTCGIYFLYWTYKVFEEMKQYSGEGVGGVVGLVIGIVVGFVNWFLIPSEVGNMYERAGQEKPVRGVTGFWNLIPLIGFIIWVVKVQGALNEYWEARGAVRPA
jgi:Domain of unknown function (DUF4234)